MILHIKLASHCQDQSTVEKRLACLADAGPQAIEDRLNAIDREWSVGRMTKAAIGVLIVVGMALAALHDPRWLMLPAVGGLLLVQYLFTRTSVFSVVFRKLGFRPGSEIEHEKFALKALRGDFRHLPTFHEIENKDDIARFEGEGGIVIDPEEAKHDAKDVIHNALEAVKL